MGPKAKHFGDLNKFEKEKKRELILTLWREGKSYAYIAKQVELVFKAPCAKSTVQYVVKSFKDRPTVAAKAGGGPKSKMTPQYGIISQILSYFKAIIRYKRKLMRLAMVHPFWGAQRLVDVLHKETLEALQARPEGAVVVVYCLSCVQCISADVFRSLSNLQRDWCRRFSTRRGWRPVGLCTSPSSPSSTRSAACSSPASSRRGGPRSGRRSSSPTRRSSA